MAESAKNGSPIETVNSPSSHRASPCVGGRPQLAAIASGKVSAAAAITATWMNGAIRAGA